MSRYDKLCLLDRQIPADALPTGRKEEYSAALCEFLCLEKERLRRSCDYCLNIALIAAMKLNPKQEVEPCFYYRDRSTAEATGMINDTILPESVEQHEDTKSMDALLDSPQCSAKEMKAVQAACNAKCPPPCTQWLFRHSTSVVSEDLPTGEILLWIVYNPIDGWAIRLVRHPQYLTGIYLSGSCYTKRYQRTRWTRSSATLAVS